MRLRLVILAIGTFAMGVDTFVIAPILDPMAQGLGVSRTTAGWLITAFALAYAAGGPPLAAAVGHRPPRTLLLGGLAVFAAGNALNAVAPGYAAAFAGRALAGAGAALYTANALAAARAMAPAERQGRATAVVVGGLTTAIVLGLPLGSQLGARVGWRAALWLIVALAAVAAAGIAAAVPALPGTPRLALRARLAPLGNARVVAALAATCLCLSASWTVYTRVDEVMRPATGGDADRASLVLLLFGAGAVAGNLAVGRLTDRFGAARTIVCAAPLLALAVALVPPSAASLPGALAAAVCWGTLHWMINVPQQLRATAAAPGAAPLVLGLHQSTIYIGISVGGAIGAAGHALGGRTGIGYAALCAGLIGLAALAGSLWLDRRHHVPDETPPAPVLRESLK
ncbi:MFS transporter [Actinomadura opuntiae]|uniref:MFS transporter n=1 Tax=Actinomadura sp. OS1-43 TaxID=604315 RepID=UPI00255B1A84|nr:MFS transporter [Actinomadura sp. OS1-43]MDL4816496.1 MFS transporter [Actinomadura sp. OS1-43]